MLNSWYALMVDRYGLDVLKRAERGLRAPLPGIPAQLRMAPVPRPSYQAYYEVEQTCLKAGVLVLLYEKRRRLHILLTLRTDRVLHHRGQISFPGGEQHPGESVEATALRETEEELGLRLDTVRIIGRLTPLYIAPSNYCIYPTVAFLPGRLVFKPQPDEVAEVIEVAVNGLTDPKTVKREKRSINGRDVIVPFYAAGGHKIWGATAMVLAEFLAVIETAKTEP